MQANGKIFVFGIYGLIFGNGIDIANLITLWFFKQEFSEMDQGLIQCWVPRSNFENVLGKENAYW